MKTFWIAFQAAALLALLSVSYGLGFTSGYVNASAAAAAPSVIPTAPELP